MLRGPTLMVFFFLGFQILPSWSFLLQPKVVLVWQHHDDERRTTMQQTKTMQTKTTTKMMNPVRTCLWQSSSSLQAHENDNESDKSECCRLNPLLSLIQPSQTVEIFSRVKEMRNEGIDVTGGLCVGEPDFGPPPEVITATIQALENGDTRYTAVAGTIPLRQAIAQDLTLRKGIRYNPLTEIVVANGAKQAVYQGILAMAGVGDTVLIPAPYWPSYPEMVKLAGAEPVIMETTAESGYLLSPTQLRNALESCINNKPRLLILCNPSNPTGGVYSKKALEGLCQVLLDFPNVFVLADEIYDQLVYGSNDDDHDEKNMVPAASRCPSIASLPGMWDRTITINGFSKSYAMTGFRLGYLAAPQVLARACTTLQSQFTSCASSLSQAAGLAALTQVSDAWLPTKVLELKQKRDHCLTRLAEMPNVMVHVPPQGAFYVLPNISAYAGSDDHDDVQFCRDLLQEQELALVPGSSFGARGTVRISYATSLEELNIAMDKLSAFLQSRK